MQTRFCLTGHLYLGMSIQNIVFRELEVPLDGRKLFRVRGSLFATFKCSLDKENVMV